MSSTAPLRPHVVATVLFAREEADSVRELLEAIAPDQSLSFLLLEEDAWSDDDRLRCAEPMGSFVRSSPE